ncbi:MAG: sigma-70 family RNA polymerase sigma factor [Phycisphaerales bacterium]
MRKKPESHASDADLVARCLAGEDGAWSTLIDRYARLVYSIPARHGLSRQDSDDVFQDVWALAVKHLNTLRDGQTVAAWLITTTQRETWRVLRKRTPTPTSEAAEVEAEIGTHAEFELLEGRQRLREALARLGEPCRALLEALFREDRPSYDVIAEQLSMPRGSIGPTRARCLHKLTELVEEAPKGR